MALPSRRPLERALTASATKLKGREQDSYTKRRTMPWQLRALSYYDMIGELNFTAKFLARQISRVRFYPAKLLPDQTTEPIIEGPPVEVLNQIQDPGGGRSRLQFDYGRLMFITGEGVLFGYRLESEVQRWKFLWKDEVKRLESGQYVRLDFEKKETNDVGEAYRFWTPHPRHSDEPDSPMRAVEDIAEELLILTAAVRSTAVTRFTRGLMVIPSEISPNPPGTEGDEDPQQSVFLSDWMEHSEAQKENPGSAAAAMPFLLEASYEYLDRVQWLKTHDPATDYMEKELRLEAIKRLALSLDMSPEDLLGYTDANHWTGRQVQLDRWRMFGYNKAEQFADDLADSFLRPALEKDGYSDWENVVIEFDDSQVVISPDRTEDALKAHNQGIINGAAAREALGWRDSDKLEGEEKEEFFALKLRSPELLDGEMALPARGPLPGQNGGNPADGPPEPSANRGVSRQESRTASILGAAALALRQCRAKAGARLRSHQHECQECKEAEGPHSIVASVIGAEQVQALGLDPIKLVGGGTEEFRGFLCEQGIEETQAASLCQRIEVYAAQTLFEARQPELPPGFSAQVTQAEEVSSAVLD